MNATELLSSREWHKMGKWKNPFLVVSAMTPQILQAEGTAIPFSPSSYIIVNYAQYVPSGEYEQNIAGATQMFEKDFEGTHAALVQEVEESTQKMYEWHPTQPYAEFAQQIKLFCGRQVRNWYEIMLADGALSQIFPKTLPDSFPLEGETYTRNSILTKCALPKKLFPLGQERIIMLKIAAQMQQGNEVSNALIEHSAKFGWLSALSWWDEPFSAEYYNSRAHELSKQEPQKMLEEFEQKRREQYAEGERLLELVEGKFPKAFQCLDAIRTLADLKEENWDVVSSRNPVVRPVFRKLAAQYALSVPQVMQMLHSEFAQLIEKGKMPSGVDADELNARMKNHALFNIHEEKMFFASAEKAQALHKLLDKEAPNLSELKGTPIWGGIVRAKACVLNNVDEMQKMKKGNVLVCPMSDPDYLPAINKAAAIVADQGGLLCHAAIVARELQIPCVVGTEYATKLFKDGDEIEVDAVNGVVKIV